MHACESNGIASRWTLTGALILVASLANAAPGITGVSGTVADGQNVVITGTAFGSNSLQQEWLGGSTGFVDSLANGTRIDTQGRPGWSLLTPSTPTYPHVSTERSWSGGKSIAFDTRGTTEYKQTLFYDTGASGFTNLYTNALIYLDHDDLLPGSYLQWKMMRWYKVADVQDHMNNLSAAYMSNPMGGNNVGVLTGWNTDEGQFVYWFNVAGRTNLPGRRAWYRYETWMRMNSSPGTADGRYRVKVTNPLTGQVVTDNTIQNLVINGRGDTGNLRYYVIQNYFGNATDGGYSQAANGHAVAWWDDIFISQSEARVELCAAATWSQCTSREIQSASTWADNRITVRLNKGAQTAATGYLYVVDSTGQVNAQGYPLSAGPRPQKPSNPAVR